MQPMCVCLSKNTKLYKIKKIKMEAYKFYEFINKFKRITNI